MDRQKIGAPKVVPTRDAHGPGWSADRGGSAWAERALKWAEILPRKKQGLHEKTKISYKTNIKFTFCVENFFVGFAPELHLSRRLRIIYLFFIIFES